MEGRAGGDHNALQSTTTEGVGDMILLITTARGSGAYKQFEEVIGEGVRALVQQQEKLYVFCEVLGFCLL